MPRKFHDDGELLLRSLPGWSKEEGGFQVAKFDRGKGEREGKEEEDGDDDDDDSIKTRGKNYLPGRARHLKGSAMCFEKGEERKEREVWLPTVGRRQS